MISFLKNIFWLNIKKLKQNVFWRVVFVLINYMFFASTIILTPENALVSTRAFYFIFIIVSLSNMMFLYIKITSGLTVVSLYREIGASRSFIIVNNMIEMLFLNLFALIFFAITIIFFSFRVNLFALSLLQIVMIELEALIFSLVVINRAEKIEKAT